MISAKVPANEADRLAALKALGVLDSQAEAEFDALVKVASTVCDVPMSLISLVDSDRQWFKANVGLPGVHETGRDISFCSHAIHGEEIFEVPNVLEDARFSDNPLVTQSPEIRFYAGAPIRLSSGHLVGTLCVLDRIPRKLTQTQRTILGQLSIALAIVLETRASETHAQVDLFAPPPVSMVVQDNAMEVALQAINPDVLSPREALDALYALKKLMNRA